MYNHYCIIHIIVKYWIFGYAICFINLICEWKIHFDPRSLHCFLCVIFIVNEKPPTIIITKLKYCVSIRPFTIWSWWEASSDRPRSNMFFHLFLFCHLPSLFNNATEMSFVRMDPSQFFWRMFESTAKHSADMLGLLTLL